MSKWIALQDYSNKYRISISTLRRRIKNKEIKFLLENGRYLLLDHEEITVKSRDFTSVKKVQIVYKEVLDQRNKEIAKLKEELEDLKELVALLENEKREVESLLKQSSRLKPQPLL